MAKAERRGLARGRKKQTRAKRKRHLIVSNGKVTETEYFNFLINEMTFAEACGIGILTETL